MQNIRNNMNALKARTARRGVGRDRVTEIRKQIAAGRYVTPERLNGATDRMVELLATRPATGIAGHG